MSQKGCKAGIASFFCRLIYKQSPIAAKRGLQSFLQIHIVMMTMEGNGQSRQKYFMPLAGKFFRPVDGHFNNLRKLFRTAKVAIILLFNSNPGIDSIIIIMLNRFHLGYKIRFVNDFW